MYSILHINTDDRQGGAARAAYAIHASLRKRGSTSHMLVGTKHTQDPDIAELKSSFAVARAGDSLGRAVFDRIGLQYLFNPSSFSLTQHPWLKSADVVQLYNMHGGYFSYLALSRISRLKPIVMRFSDMWAFTGHCSYSLDCERWETGCGHCPYLETYPGLKIDTTALLWKQKKASYQRSQVSLVVTNSWMRSLVRRSPLVNRFTDHLIPNGVDQHEFSVMPKEEARKALNIDPALQCILFIAHVADPNTRKGGKHLIAALSRLRDAKDILLLVVGEGAGAWPETPGIITRRMDHIEETSALRNIYNAADVLVHPAIAENLPNTVLEAAACGLPSVAFDSGGTKDVVRHMHTGYLAPAEDVDALAMGIETMLGEKQLRKRMAAACRKLIEEEYTLDLQASRYLELYAAILGR